MQRRWLWRCRRPSWPTSGQLDPWLREPNALSIVATVVAAGSLAWRRRRPGVSYGVSVAGCLVVSGSGHYIAGLSVLLLVSLYSLTTHASRRDAAVGLGVGAASFVGLALAGEPDLRMKDLWLSLALLVAAWAVGEVVWTRRDLQRDQVRAAIVEERLRIAREPHDVVAHSRSLIAVQAGVGAHVIQTYPVRAGRALEIIAETSRKALEQIRSMLGMLREEDDEGNRPPGSRGSTTCLLCCRTSAPRGSRWTWSGRGPCRRWARPSR